jgi:hypothetical protein
LPKLDLLNFLIDGGARIDVRSPVQVGTSWKKEKNTNKKIRSKKEEEEPDDDDGEEDPVKKNKKKRRRRSSHMTTFFCHQTNGEADMGNNPTMAYLMRYGKGISTMMTTSIRGKIR